jgi:hypothetical protein
MGMRTTTTVIGDGATHESANRMRRKIIFALPFNGIGVSALPSPKIVLPFFRKSCFSTRVPFLPGGALRDRHECWARDAMDAAALPDEARLRGRQRRVVLIPRRWDQALRHVSQGDGGYQARTPGRARYKP